MDEKNFESVVTAPLASANHAAVSTSVVDAKDRRAFWSDFVCARLVQVECIDVVDPERFSGSIDQCAIGGISVSTVASHAQRVKRGSRLIALADEDQVLVNIQRRGRSVLRQDGREAVLEPGDLAIYTSDRPYELEFDDAFSQTVVILPADALRALVPDVARGTAKRIASSHATTALLRQAAQTFREEAATTTANTSLAHVMLNAVAVCAAQLSGDAKLLRRADDPRRAASAQDEPVKRKSSVLTVRETEVVRLLARGCRHAEVARMLGMSLNTVRTHVRNIHGKLGVHGNTEAIYEANVLGILS